MADHLIAVEPEADFVSLDSVDGAPAVPDRARAIGQIPICWDPDEDTAVNGRTSSSAGSRAGGR